MRSPTQLLRTMWPLRITLRKETSQSCPAGKHLLSRNTLGPVTLCSAHITASRLMANRLAKFTAMQAYYEELAMIITEKNSNHENQFSYKMQRGGS